MGKQLSTVTVKLYLRSLGVTGFRNLVSQQVALGPNFNVLVGANGQGKTNFIEAVYLTGTGRSFRAARPAEMIRSGSPSATVRAVVADERELAGVEERIHLVELKPSSRAISVSDRESSTLVDVAVRTPMVPFGPGSIELSTGPGIERRRLLDRIALASKGSAQANSYVAILSRYRRALSSRRALLERSDPHDRALSAYEEVACTHGLEIVAARQHAYELLRKAFEAVMDLLAAAGDRCALAYRTDTPDTLEAYTAALFAQRRASRTREPGPHRDDLIVHWNGRRARTYASQGQHRLIVLALKLAEISVLSDATGCTPIFLLDDVSSELDVDRNDALFRFLERYAGQVFVSTTRNDTVRVPGSRRDFVVESGHVRAV